MFSTSVPPIISTDIITIIQSLWLGLIRLGNPCLNVSLVIKKKKNPISLFLKVTHITTIRKHQLGRDLEEQAEVKETYELHEN